GGAIARRDVVDQQRACLNERRHQMAFLSSVEPAFGFSRSIATAAQGWAHTRHQLYVYTSRASHTASMQLQRRLASASDRRQSTVGRPDPPSIEELSDDAANLGPGPARLRPAVARL